MEHVEMRNTIPALAIVIPCFNEEEVLPVTAPLFLGKLKSLIARNKIAPESCILYVDDGSRDRTWQIIRRLAKDAHIIGIRQSRNRGHQNTVLAGLMEAKDLFDITISIDCDGQDDLDAMDQMVDAYLHGYEVVYGVRSSREEDNFCKRFTAEAFYRLMRLLGAEVVFNHADYRLISGRVLRELAEFKEVNIFLRGLVPLAGFESTSVYYKRHRRAAGKSHYPLGKMLGLAFDGITSLSARPIHTITSMGLMVSALSFVMIVWIVVCFCMGRTVQGWASTCVIASFIGGIQLLCTGVIGEYVGKIYLETKARPRYIISERTFEREDLL